MKRSIELLFLITLLVFFFTACNQSNSNTTTKDTDTETAGAKVKSGVKPQPDPEVGVIDTADYMEKTIQKQAATEHGCSDYGKIGYGKGPVTVVNIWRNFTQMLDDVNHRYHIEACCRERQCLGVRTDQSGVEAGLCHSHAQAAR